jgi:hypothetical protein
MLEQSDSIIGEESGLGNFRNSVGYCQEQLVEEKAVIVRSNTSRTRFSSPIWRLPTEILSEIFLYCLPEDEHLMYTSRQAPMLLTRICRRWREIAVGLPMLWCSLQLQMRYDDWKKRAFCYDSWLKRSGGRPLSLRIRCRPDRNNLQSLLQPYVQQISSLSLDFLRNAGPFIMEDFLALKELTISQYYLDDSPRAINGSLSKLPVNLRRINMENVWINERQLYCFPDSAWARLTHIEITVDGLYAFARILRLCPDLSHLKIVGVFHSIQIPESVMHTNLQSLCMCWRVLRHSGEDLGLFKVMTLPNLRVLEASHRGLWPHEDFMEFLTRSKYPLEKMVLDSVVSTTARQRAEYATLIPSFDIISGAGRPYNVDEEWKDQYL